MRWWCSAQATAWTWAWQPYPGVWAFIAAIAIGYFLLTRDVPGGTNASRRAALVAGLLALWFALDWPLGALGAGYLASAHMAQFLLIALVAPPLLLYSVPPAAFVRILGVGRGPRALSLATQPIAALVIFNVVVIATHWPPLVDALMPTQLGSFVLDVSWLLAGAVFWWPLVVPIPERPRFVYWLKIAYLIAATIVNTPLFAYLTFSDFPLYATFELAPPLAGISSRTDQQLAGLLMKVGGGLILWTGITVLFARWYLREGREE